MAIGTEKEQWTFILHNDNFSYHRNIFTSFQSCDFSPNVRVKMGPSVRSSEGRLTRQTRLLAVLISSGVKRKGALGRPTVFTFSPLPLFLETVCRPNRFKSVSTFLTLAESSFPVMRLKMCSIASFMVCMASGYT